MPRATSPRRFAEGTKVPIERSKAEVEKLVRAHGADQFFSAIDHTTGAVDLGFRLKRWFVRFRLVIPKKGEAEQRRMWRALVLVLKSKLESVQSGIATFEQEFLAHIVCKSENGQTQTVGELMLPQLEDAYERGEAPKGLPYFGG